MSAFAVVQPSGILDGNHGNELRNQVMDLVRDGSLTILIDFQEISFMNSSGIGALVAMLKSIKAAGATLYVCSLSDQVKVIFRLTKMDRVFKPLASRQEFEQTVLAGSQAE